METADFKSRIEDHSAVIAVLGLGYVGLPLALMFSEKGFRVIGYDVDRGKVKSLQNGSSYIREIPAERVQSALARHFLPTDQADELKAAQVFIICVPTPLGQNSEPFMDYVLATCKTISAALKAGDLVSLESTVYPGATRGMVADTLGESGLVAGTDFHLAYSPERIDPGSGFPLEEVPKLVAGLTPLCTELGVCVYSQIFNNIIPVSTVEVAETAKLHENIYRAVNIALANELRIICRTLGIDAWDVIDAAATKPYGFSPFYPGPGIGGHCIPIDPHYLAWRAHQEGIQARFIGLAAKINEAVPQQLLDFTSIALAQRGCRLNGAKVLILGVAYKRDVDDMRESPAIDLIELLNQQGAHVIYHDPYIPRVVGLRQTSLEMESMPLSEELLEAQDVAIITTDHNCVDYGWIASAVRLLIDPRGVTRRLGIRAPHVLVY